MTPRQSRRAAAPLLTFLAAVACGDRPALPGQDFEVTADAAVLDGYVQLRSDTPLSIDAVAGARATPARELALVAEVAVPEVGGEPLAATHVALLGNAAFVTFAAPGEPSAGAVASFDVSDPARPRLVSLATTAATDLNAVAFDGNTLYLAGATLDALGQGRAVLDALEVRGGAIAPAGGRAEVASYAGTGVALVGELVFVTSGSGGEPVGGVTALSRGSLELLGADPFEDARAVAVTPGGQTGVALQGGPGRLRLYDARTGALKVADVPLGGAAIPASKGSLAVDGDLVFAAVGDGGLRVASLAQGAVVASLPRPELEGVAPEDAVTNAVAEDGDLLFLANGGAGVWVASKGLSRSGAPSPAVVGRIAFSGPVSANFVAARNGLLFVAAGRGGLKVVRVLP